MADKIIEAIVGAIVFFAIFPALIGLISEVNQPKIIPPSGPTPEEINLTQRLDACYQQLGELNASIVTKQDFAELRAQVEGIKENVVNIYNTQTNYIENRFYFVVSLSITITLSLSISLFVLIDLTIFGGELWVSIKKTIINRFHHKSQI